MLASCVLPADHRGVVLVATYDTAADNVIAAGNSPTAQRDLCYAQAAQRARAARSMQGLMARAMMSNNASMAFESQKYGSSSEDASKK